MDDFIKQETSGIRPPSQTVPQKQTPLPKSNGIFSQLEALAKPSRKVGGVLLGPVGRMAVDEDFRNSVKDVAVGTVKSIAKTAIQMPRAMIAGIKGTMGDVEGEREWSKPVDVPVLGKVKGLTAIPGQAEKYDMQSNWETVGQAADMWLTVGAPGAGKAFGMVKKTLPSTSKTAEALSSIPARQFEKAAEPEMARTIKKVRETGMGETPQDLALMGEDAYNKAAKLMGKVKTEYGESRAALIKAKKGKLIQRSKDFVTGVNSKLAKEGIDTTGDALDFLGSTFEGDDAAQNTIRKAHELMTRPRVQREGLSVAEDLINRRQAISSLKNKVPIEESNLRRVLGEMKSSFDDTLDNVLGKEAGEMRAKYAQTKEITAPIMDAMTTVQNGKKVFSMDKASGFIKQAMSDMKFDKNALLQKLDDAVGTTFAKDVQAIGLDKAISRLTPPTASRLADVAKSYIALNPVTKYLIPFFSPKFWGDQAVRQGLKSSTKGVAEANKLNKLLLINLLAAPVRQQINKENE